MATIWFIGGREIDASNEFKALFKAIVKPPLTDSEVMKETNCGWSENAAQSFYNAVRTGKFKLPPTNIVETN
ncbi:hypothetical protein [Pseudovibrio sp. Alg231-02]|uniref:hypothetical protein n=1 Tax=Pseudovibrio sp. Alg231-02 TaxID=1922223 RepID=UPI00131F272C|nr:hypothetical protein [Pseudovibrio sp. Alg231-02]